MLEFIYCFVLFLLSAMFYVPSLCSCFFIEQDQRIFGRINFAPPIKSSPTSRELSAAWPHCRPPVVDILYLARLPLERGHATTDGQQRPSPHLSASGLPDQNEWSRFRKTVASEQAQLWCHKPHMDHPHPHPLHLPPLPLYLGPVLIVFGQRTSSAVFGSQAQELSQRDRATAAGITVSILSSVRGRG